MERDTRDVLGPLKQKGCKMIGNEKGESTLVLGTLIGYRAWIPGTYRTLVKTTDRVSIDWNKTPWGRDSYLTSCGEYYKWKVLKTKASCRNKKPGHAHGQSPADKCSCGLYGFYDIGDVGKSFPMVNAACIHGAFQAWGRVILGTKGFRCEYAKVCGLVAGKDPDMTKHIASLYGVPVFETYGDLVKEFPRSDVSSLIQ